MLSRLRALLITAPFIVLDTLVFGTLSMLASLFDKTGYTQHRIARIWARAMLVVSGTRLEVEGVEKLDPNGSYVLVSNHLSLMDTPVVIAHIPLQFRFFAKEGLFRIPLLGGHLRRAGHFSVLRDNPRAGLRTMGEGARMLRQHGTSVLVFPEGGRSDDGDLHEFRPGAAYIAIKGGVPAVPIGITGTREILPMGSIQVLPGHARLLVGDPIPTTGLKPQDHARLTEELRRRIALLTGQSAPVQCK
ncbi:MAG TPA: lysophospholipid acyltransferase family protein [Bryobacteraceae bacterium]|nr:lysophospholipid acyltransferase family protein [Bryobacteraceae bacterium]